MYAICVCKATRPVTVAKEYVETLQEAIEKATFVYDYGVVLLRAFLPSGISVIIVEQVDLEMFLTDRCSWGKLTRYQFGTY